VIFSPTEAQYLCPKYLHHNKPLIASECFIFLPRNPQHLLTVWCALMQLKTSHPFWTEYDANHSVYQALPFGRLKLKEQWTSWDKLYLKFTPLASRTFAEAPLMTVHEVKCALHAFFWKLRIVKEVICTGLSYILVSSVLWRYTAHIFECSYVLHSYWFLQLDCNTSY
jgi:hypothetical protein